MRADFKKVLCERPRRGGLYSYSDFRHRQNHGDPDYLPSHQGMKRPYGWDTKDFDDLLGPLRKFLRRRVGSRWDDVWSEICQQVNSGNTIDQHLRGHVLSEVDTQTFMEDGQVRCWGHRGGSPTAPGSLYVDPRDGLIHANDDPPRWQRPTWTMVDGLPYHQGDNGLLFPVKRYHMAGAKYPLKLIGRQKAMLIEGIWYWVEMAETPPVVNVPYVTEWGTKFRRVTYPRYDFVIGRMVECGRYHVSKRQMTSQDLRRNGLRNIR